MPPCWHCPGSRRVVAEFANVANQWAQRSWSRPCPAWLHGSPSLYTEWTSESQILLLLLLLLIIIKCRNCSKFLSMVFRNKARITFAENKGHVRSSLYFESLEVKFRKLWHVTKRVGGNVLPRLRDFFSFSFFLSFFLKSVTGLDLAVVQVWHLCLAAAGAKFGLFWPQSVFCHLWGFHDSQPSSGLKQNVSPSLICHHKSMTGPQPLRLPRQRFITSPSCLWKWCCEHLS